jgi:hypothetical protein
MERDSSIHLAPQSTGRLTAARLPPGPARVTSLMLDAKGFTLATFPARNPVTDQPETVIAVHSWRQREVRAYALYHAIGHAEQGLGAAVPQGLLHPYLRLASYVPPNAYPYIPEQALVSFWISERAESAPLWPLSPSLAELRQQASGDFLLVEGALAGRV